MRERLVELIKEAHDGQKYITSDKSINAIADCLLADGWIRPPCKVGDKLYAISESRIAECTCYEFSMHNELQICAEFNCDYDCKGCPFSSWSQEYSGEYSCRGEYGEWFFSESDFGKTVFLSREDAERALKGDKGK